MSVTVEWDDQAHTVVRITLSGRWSLDELRTGSNEANLMHRGLTYPIYVVTDLRESEAIPIGVLWELRTLVHMRPDNWGGGIVITQDPIARNLVDIFGQVYMRSHHRRLFAVNSADDAQEVIARLKQEDTVS